VFQSTFCRPCRDLRTHDEVAHRCLQLSCSLQETQSLHSGLREHYCCFCAGPVFVLESTDVTADNTSRVLLYTSPVVCNLSMLITLGKALKKEN
jgi:hypothetical protein